MDDNETEKCCGSGCTNCVLDRELSMPKVSKEDCVNVMNQNYSNFKLTFIEQRTPNTYQLSFNWHKKSITENAEQKRHILQIPGGSYLMLRAPKYTQELKLNPIYQDFHKTLHEIPKDSNFQGKFLQKHDTTEEDLFISRPYTPVFVDEDNCQFTILLKLEPFGRMSEFILSLQVGALTEWKGVFNNIPLSIKSKFSHVICFSHGVSIAPFYTLSKELTEDETFDSNIHLYACFKDMTCILLRDKLIELNGYWNFKSTIFLSRERHNESCDFSNCKKGMNTKKICCCSKPHQRFSETLFYGRIDRYFLRDSIQTLDEKILVLLCGSESFTSPIIGYLQEQCDNKDIEIQIL